MKERWRHWNEGKLTAAVRRMQTVSCVQGPWDESVGYSSVDLCLKWGRVITNINFTACETPLQITITGRRLNSFGMNFYRLEKTRQTFRHSNFTIQNTKMNIRTASITAQGPLLYTNNPSTSSPPPPSQSPPYSSSSASQSAVPAPYPKSTAPTVPGPYSRQT